MNPSSCEVNVVEVGWLIGYVSSILHIYYIITLIVSFVLNKKMDIKTAET